MKSLYSLTFSPATPHNQAVWNVFGAGFGLRCFPSREKAIAEAEEYFGIANFTIRVFPNKTVLNITAAPDADPKRILDIAISALIEERNDLSKCPVHNRLNKE